MRKVFHVCAVLLGLIALSQAAHAESNVASFDVVGIKLGDDQETAIAKLKAMRGSSQFTKFPGLCAQQRIDHATSMRRTELNVRQGRCLISFSARIDMVSTVTLWFEEDFPSRPGKGVVTKINVDYHYYAKGANAPSVEDVRKQLVAKFSEPDRTLGATLECGSC